MEHEDETKTGSDGGGTSSGRISKPPRKKRYARVGELNSVSKGIQEFMVEKGWKRRRVQKGFAGTTDEVFVIEGEQYETDEYYCRLYAQAWFHETDKTDAFHERLLKCGMSKSFIDRLYPVMDPLIDTCYSDEHLFDMMLDYALGEGHLEPLTPATSRFPFEDIPQDTWVKREGVGLVCNVSKKRAVRKHIDSLPRSNATSDFTLFYHCTNWNHGRNIINIGPKTYEGRKCLDFGISPSFYVTPDVGTAIDWAERNTARWSAEVVILIFRVSNKILEGRSRHFEVKVFRNPDEEWKTLVKSSRMCRDEKNDLDDYNFVYGPIAKNVKGIKTRGEDPVASNGSQMAVKREKAEEYLKKNCMGSLWLNKHEFRT